MREDLIVAIYGGFQLSMRELDLCDNKGRPNRVDTLVDQDTVAIYNYFAHLIVNHSKGDLTEISEKFNNVVKELSDEYNINNFMLMAKIAEAYFEEYGDRTLHVLMVPKVNRLITFINTKVTKEIAIETTQAASNIYRMMAGISQLTKEERAANVERWKSSSSRSTEEASSN